MLNQSSESTTSESAQKADALELEKLNLVVAQAQDEQRKRGGSGGRIRWAVARCIECQHWFIRKSINRTCCSNQCGLLRCRKVPHDRHGMARSEEYRIWRGMIQRCTNAKDLAWPKYGGRGITVCERWRDFANFFQDMGHRPSKGHSLDRKNNDGNYDPGNVRWATRKEQMRNRSDNRYMTLNGETKTVAEWAEQCGVLHSLFTKRLDAGWSDERTITTPSRITKRTLQTVQTP